MRIRERDEWKTVSRIRYSHFKYQVMFFWLKNAPSNFQEFINKILAEKLNIFVIVYLNNIFIYTNNDRDGHVAVIWWMLEQPKKFSLYAHLKNYWFY